MADDDYERVLLIKQEVMIYKIPPLVTNRGYKAADWNLDNPDWTGRLKVIAKGRNCFVRLEEKNTGQLFAEAPIDAYPGAGVQAVSDSSRYFVLRIMDGNTKRSAFIGIGFTDRGDSFDLNVALQDHFKWVQKEIEIEKSGGSRESADDQPKLDLGLKEGQTIKVNINIGKKSATARPKAKASTGGAGIILPPPPGGVKLPPPSSSSSSMSSASPFSSNFDTLDQPVLKSNNNNNDSQASTASAAKASESLLDLEFDALSLDSNRADSQKGSAAFSASAAAAASSTAFGPSAGAQPNSSSSSSSNSEWAQFL